MFDSAHNLILSRVLLLGIIVLIIAMTIVIPVFMTRKRHIMYSII